MVCHVPCRGLSKPQDLCSGKAVTPFLPLLIPFAASFDAPSRRVTLTCPNIAVSALQSEVEYEYFADRFSVRCQCLFSKVMFYNLC